MLQHCLCLELLEDVLIEVVNASAAVSLHIERRAFHSSHDQIENRLDQSALKLREQEV